MNKFENSLKYRSTKCIKQQNTKARRLDISLEIFPIFRNYKMMMLQILLNIGYLVCAWKFKLQTFKTRNECVVRA